MHVDVVTTRKYGITSYSALLIGIVCFFITFVQPTKIVMIGSLSGDYITFSLTAIGVILSIVGLLKKTKKRLLSIISLVLSLLFPIYFVLIFILLVIGGAEFGP